MKVDDEEIRKWSDLSGNLVSESIVTSCHFESNNLLDDATDVTEPFAMPILTTVSGTNKHPECNEEIFLDSSTSKSATAMNGNCYDKGKKGYSSPLSSSAHGSPSAQRRPAHQTLFSDFLDSLGIPVFAVDTSGSVSQWNRRLSTLSGLGRDGAVRVPASELIERRDRDRWARSLTSILSGTLSECSCDVSFDFGCSGKSKDETRRSLRRCRIRIASQEAIPSDQSRLVVGAACFVEEEKWTSQHENGDSVDSTCTVTVEDEPSEDGIAQPRLADKAESEVDSILDAIDTPIFGIDLCARVNEWNDGMSEMTGYSRHEVFGKPFVESFFDPRNFDYVRNLLSSALDEPGTGVYELELRGKDREVRSLHVNLCTRRGSERRVAGVVGIAQDAREAIKQDRAIAAMASELQQLIDTANAPIFGIDCDGDVNEWNNKTAEITNYTKDEAFDCNLVETFISPGMRESVRDVLDCALRGRVISNYELEFLTKSNEVRILLVNTTTRRDAENNVVGVVGVAQDVTEAVQRDRAVAGMASELRQLIDTANAPIFGIDIYGKVNEWNRRTQEITCYSKEEAFDEPLVERFIAPSMRQTVQGILDQALQGNETSNYELEFVSKSGEPRFLLVNATTRRDPEFNVVGVVGVAQDVTEDRKNAAELRKMQYLQATQAAKVETERNMTAYFAHELRNPLSAIDSALSAMPDDLPDSAESLISGMRLCSSFMSAIMNNLLDVRKMEEGKMTLNVVPISLEALIDGVHAMLLPSVRSGVEFTKSVHVGGRDWVLGDQHRIQQVLTNVVTNSIKYTISGTIDMKLSWEGGSIKFECVDTGPGIPKPQQDHLFHRFVQRGGAPGTGLGLAIAKQLVDLHNGSIRFESDPTVRSGTTCVVLLPLSLCDPPETKEDEVVFPIEQPLKVLITDDIKMNRVMLTRRLKKGIAPNCVIVEACTGEEALEICANDRFDVIIVDQYMEEAGGVMVGTDVVYAMRRMRIDSIIVGCSGNDLDREFTEAGANWVWKKPLPANAEIIAQLRLVLDDRSR